MTAPDPVAVLSEALEKATEGPWFVHDFSGAIDLKHDPSPGDVTVSCDHPATITVAFMGRALTATVDEAQANAAFIAAAKTHLPALLAEIARLREAVGKTAVCMGVGDGSGKLFVYGDSESIHACRRLILKGEQAEARFATLKQAYDRERRIRQSPIVGSEGAPADQLPDEEGASVDPVRMLRADCDRAGSQKIWAEARGISPAYVNDVLRYRRKPGDGILRALGLERVVTYRNLSALARPEPGQEAR